MRYLHMSKSRYINNILFITLSNIGDCILTLPVLDALKENFPSAKITVVAGPRSKQIFQDSPAISKCIVFDKQSSFGEKAGLFLSLRRERFEMVVDLRNSLLGMLIPARYRTNPWLIMPLSIPHMKDRHLYKIKGIMSKLGIKDYRNSPRRSLCGTPLDADFIDKTLQKHNVTGQDKIAVISPGARSHTKRWSEMKFLNLGSLLIEEFGVKVVVVGDEDDLSLASKLTALSEGALINLAGQTSIGALAYLIKKSSIVITNDSAVLHCAGYLNVPTVAIFGITDERKYGPWSETRDVVKKDMPCRPCGESQCRYATLECIQTISLREVLTAARNILLGIVQEEPTVSPQKILIVRTDRIGDTLLSTPVIKALRDAYPDAHIAMMISPYTKEIVEGNPYLNEVIIYDKDVRHKSWKASRLFARNLKEKRFDVAVILHPTNRVHLVTFFAGIPRRVGYDYKLGFLLTERIKHTKQFGRKHELEYNLDVVRALGIVPKDKNVYMPIKLESERWVDETLAHYGVTSADKLLAVHPGASCISKIWPVERFAEAADRLRQKYGFKVLIVGGPKDRDITHTLAEAMYEPGFDLGGRTSISQLASLLKRCRLFISNDSGPVHIASAVGTPVIAIFGRNQAGLSPRRWGPLGSKDKFLHKEAGCLICLAHNCKKGFKCLAKISAEDVLKVADEILKEVPR